MNLTNLLLHHEAAVVGGYARDIYHGSIPNDCDIAVYGASRHTSAEAIVKTLEAHGYTVTSETSSEGYSGDASGRYDVIYQLSIPGGMDIDVLVFSNEFATLEEVLDRFDYNLNQFALDRSTNLPVFMGCQFGQLTKLRDAQVSPCRVYDMQLKAKVLGWAV